MLEIFKHFISRDPKDDNVRAAYASWFCDAFPSTEFHGEDLLMYKFLEYSSEVLVPLKEKYLEVFLATELQRILIETRARVPGVETFNLDEPLGLAEALRITQGSMYGSLRELALLESDVSDFLVDVRAFMGQQLKSRLTLTLQNVYNNMSATDDVKSSLNYAAMELQTLDEIYSEEILEELTESGGVRESIHFICDTGIPAMDNDSRGIYTTYLVGIEAQPGAGKTRFTLGVWIYRALTIYKENCLFLALEQSKEEIEAMLVSRHTYFLFNLQVNSDLIFKNEVPDDLKDKVAAAKLDLFESGKYGKVYICETDLYLETFIQKIRTLDKLHGPFTLIAIDYMGLIEQLPQVGNRRSVILEDYKIISRAYRKFKRYVRNSRKAGIAIGQFNDKGISAGEADQDITTNMAQGGINIYRHTDENYAMSMTAEMKAQSKRRMSKPKIRNTAGFQPFILDTRPGICYFYQMAQKVV